MVKNIQTPSHWKFFPRAHIYCLLYWATLVNQRWTTPAHLRTEQGCPDKKSRRVKNKIGSGEKDVCAWRWIQFRVSLGFEVQMRDLIKTRAVFNCSKIWRNFRPSWPKPPKNHCFHKITCIIHTNGSRTYVLLQSWKRLRTKKTDES